MESAYCRNVDKFAWAVIRSVAGVVGAAAAIVFGLISRLRGRQEPKGDPRVPGEAGVVPAVAVDGDVPVVVGEIPKEPAGFQPRAGLLAGLDKPGRVVVVRAVTGMRGVGKTQLAAEYARARLAQRWRLVAWINAEDADELLAGLAAVAAALGLEAGDREVSGRSVRHWLEAGGHRCLLVFDNATDPAALRPFIPAAGAARVIITSNERSMGRLGKVVPVKAFTEQEALAFLAERTGSADVAGARLVAAELGYLPLALAQAAAVIAGQRLGARTWKGCALCRRGSCGRRRRATTCAGWRRRCCCRLRRCGPMTLPERRWRSWSCWRCCRRPGSAGP